VLPQTPWLHFRGLTSKEKRGKRRKQGEKKKNKRDGTGEKKKEGRKRGLPIHVFGYAAEK